MIFGDAERQKRPVGAAKRTMSGFNEEAASAPKMGGEAGATAVVQGSADCVCVCVCNSFKSDPDY